MSLADQSQQWFPTSVQVTVLQAKNLRIKGKNGTNDAYAIMQVAKDKFSTSVAEKCVAPVWKEEATFDLPLFHQGNADRCTLHVHVMHRALVGPDKLLGQAVINLLDLEQNKARNKTEWFKLLDKSGKADKDRGEVLVTIQFMKNNMTASMFDLSGQEKSRSRMGKLKDKLRGKKKEGLSDSASAVVPSFTQVMTDSEEEEDGEGGGAGGATSTPKKKKNKLKSLFAPKSNLQRNASQSMSTLGPLPERDSALGSSRSSGLNVDSPEGKKKFKFLTHKRTGSSDSKSSLGSFSGLGQPKQSSTLPSSNLCINGSHVYAEEPERKPSRASSTFSLSSSGHGSMEELRKSSTQSRNSFTTSAESLRTSGLHLQAEEKEEEEQRRKMREEEEERRRLEEEEEEKLERLEKEKMEQEQRIQEEREQMEREAEEEMERKEEERRRLKEEEEKRRAEEERLRKEQERQMEEERIRKEEEEERRRAEEERLRLEQERRMEEERIRKEEERRRAEEERLRQEQERQMEEERKRAEEEQARKAHERQMEEERRAEEERQRKEQERLIEEKRRMEEERVRREQERLIEEERRKAEDERVRKEQERRRLEEEERIRREEEEERERMEREKEKERQRIDEERQKEEEEERIRREEEQRREEERLEEEERRRIEEEERLIREERERIWREEEEKMELERQKEEEIKRAEERREAEEKEERRRVEEQVKEEERRIFEEEERLKREKEDRVRMEREEEEERQRIEDERARKEEEGLEEEREMIRREEERRRVEREKERAREEEERLRVEEEERMKRVEEERRRVEEERMKMEEEDRLRREEERKKTEREERIRKEEEERIKREEEERQKKLMEEEKKKKREKEEEDKRQMKQKEEEERMRLEQERMRENILQQDEVEAEMSVTANPFEEVSSTHPLNEGLSTNPFEEPSISSNPFEDSPVEAGSAHDQLSHSSKVSTVKPSLTSVGFPRQRSQTPSNPFLTPDDPDDILGSVSGSPENLTGVWIPHGDRTEKKRRAPSPPMRKLTQDADPAKPAPAVPPRTTTHGFGDQPPHQLIGDGDHRATDPPSSRQDKRPAPQPPTHLKKAEKTQTVEDISVASAPHQTPLRSDTIPPCQPSKNEVPVFSAPTLASQVFRNALQNYGLSLKGSGKGEKVRSSKCSTVEVSVRSQDSNGTEKQNTFESSSIVPTGHGTNPFLEPSKHNKGPAPQPRTSALLEKSPIKAGPQGLSAAPKITASTESQHNETCSMDPHKNTSDVSVSRTVKDPKKLEVAEGILVQSAKPEDQSRSKDAGETTHTMAKSGSAEETKSQDTALESQIKDVEKLPKSDALSNEVSMDAPKRVSEKKIRAPLPPANIPKTQHPQSPDDLSLSTSSDATATSPEPCVTNSVRSAEGGHIQPAAVSSSSTAVGSSDLQGETKGMSTHSVATASPSKQRVRLSARVDALPLLAPNGASEDLGKTNESMSTSTSRRPHAVKPLSAQEPTPAPRMQPKQEPTPVGMAESARTRGSATKAPVSEPKGPYSQLTQEELISLVLRQQEQLAQRSSKIQELEEYIDNLVLRVIEEQPSILMSLSSPKKGT